MYYKIESNLHALYYPSLVSSIPQLNGVQVNCELEEFEGSLVAYASEPSDDEYLMLISPGLFLSSIGVSYEFNNYAQVVIKNPVYFTTKASSHLVEGTIQLSELMELIAEFGIKEVSELALPDKYVVGNSLLRLGWYNDPLERFFRDLGMTRITNAKYMSYPFIYKYNKPIEV